jgi:ELP3 family radical SAM enzyme/protein acetyltransferase
MLSSTEIDIEELDKKYDLCVQRTLESPTLEDVNTYKDLVLEILSRNQDYTKHEILKALMRKHKCVKKNSYVFQVFLLMNTGNATDKQYIREVLRIKAGKSHSGIISVTVFTSGTPEWIDPVTSEKKSQTFSCQWNCHYCPNEPGQPRSYLKGEPGVLRANRSNFDCVSQMHERLKALYLCGHECDKLEVLVLGGTWVSYPVDYREQFIRDIYYAANTFCVPTMDVRDKLTLTEEKAINRGASSKVIGLTLETRPDTITAKELKLLRYYGCTRVQLGIQHLDDDVLKAINRQCRTSTVIKAIKLLKDSGYKIDGHFMPNLPGSTLEKDTDMFMNRLLGVQSVKMPNDRHYIYELQDDTVQVDQWKVYPTTIVPWTKIEEMFREGLYIPYDKQDMKTMLIEMKSNVFPWIRLNRIVRDIPDDYSILTDYRSNLRQDLLSEMAKMGKSCNCCRCREVKTQSFNIDEAFMTIRQYNSSQSDEYFISYESEDCKTLYGFLRLRLTYNSPLHIFPELEGCALIRELHVYGQLQPVGANSSHVQHKGMGRRLIVKAQEIAMQKGYHKMSVISGEGTRDYYAKFGFQDTEGAGHFMIKTLTVNDG